jgi:hypothetical protein
MRPPRNRLIEDLYTRGDEFLIEATYENYVGFYHSNAGKNYIGAKYSPTALALTQYTSNLYQTAYDINNIDPVYLRNNPDVMKLIKQDNFPIIRSTYSDNNGPQQRYFIQQKNKIDAPIIEVNLVTYKNAQINPLYLVTSIFWNPPYSPEEELTRIERELPGVLLFIENSSLI